MVSEKWNRSGGKKGWQIKKLFRCLIFLVGAYVAYEQMCADPTAEHLNPLAVLQTLEDSLPDNAILVADGGDFVGSAAYILR